MAVAHGRMTAETIHLVAPHLDAVEEAHLLDAQEGIDTDGLQVFNAAPLLLRSLPPGSWGVVTSGNLRTASTRLRYGGFPFPLVLVTAEDVQRGKPEPEAYLLGAQRLGVPPAQCVVIEDAPAGIAAAHAAGMRAIAVATTHDQQALGQADMIVPELASVAVIVEGGRLRVTAEPL